MKLELSQQIALSPSAKEKLLACLARSTVRAWVYKALNTHPKLKHAQITLRWVDAKEGRSLNHQHRGAGKDYATNVLTFAYGVDRGVLSADIVLCWPVLVKEAKEQKKQLRHHGAHLIFHGVLHAMGYDHENETDAMHMESLEVKLLSSLGMANPYL